MKRKDEIIARRVGEFTLLVPTGSRVLDLNGLITLNDTALCIWEHLDGQHSAPEIAEVLSERFEVERAKAERDVRDFLTEIDRLGLLE